MTRRPERLTPGYIAIVCAACTLAVLAGWTDLASRMNRDAYDWLFRIHPPIAHPPQSVVLAVDEETLTAMGGRSGLRQTLAEGLDRILPARPAVVAVDLILSDRGSAADNKRLAQNTQSDPG
jgi:CHASE2 domain-containing sensor protein